MEIINKSNIWNRSATLRRTKVGIELADILTITDNLYLNSMSKAIAIDWQMQVRVHSKESISTYVLTIITH